MRTRLNLKKKKPKLETSPRTSGRTYLISVERQNVFFSFCRNAHVLTFLLAFYSVYLIFNFRCSCLRNDNILYVYGIDEYVTAKEVKELEQKNAHL